MAENDNITPKVETKTETVAPVQATVTANQNLEIALGTTPGVEPEITTTGDSGDNHTWGGLVTFTTENAGISLGPSAI